MKKKRLDSIIDHLEKDKTPRVVYVLSSGQLPMLISNKEILEMAKMARARKIEQKKGKP